MKPLHLLKNLFLLALFLLVASNVLLPAVARAQFVAQGGGASVSQVLAALVGQDVAAARFTATASSGVGHSCNSALASCLDLGPGALNQIGTNASGEILFGPEGNGATVAKTGGSFTASSGITAGLVIDCYFGCVIKNSIGPVHLEDTDGIQQTVYADSTLGTCNSAVRGVRKVLAYSGADDRECLCVRLADGTSYAWRNTTTGTAGTATTCAP